MEQHQNQPPSSQEATEGLWTIEDVARYARCSLRHVSKLRELGLPHRKLGNLVRFNPKTVKAWLGD
jgi:excisionase family DNA binding protein